MMKKTPRIRNCGIKPYERFHLKMGVEGTVLPWEQISRGAKNPEFPTKSMFSAVVVWWHKICQGIR